MSKKEMSFVQGGTDSKCEKYTPTPACTGVLFTRPCLMLTYCGGDGQYTFCLGDDSYTECGDYRFSQ